MSDHNSRTPLQIFRAKPSPQTSYYIVGLCVKMVEAIRQTFLTFLSFLTPVKVYGRSELKILSNSII